MRSFFRRRTAPVAVLACVVLISACTTQRVETEFSALDKALIDVSKAIAPKLRQKQAAEEDQSVRISADAGDLWFLSDECSLVLSADASAPVGACEIESVALDGRAPFIGEATAAQRKLGVLQAYIASLDTLMNAKLDGEVNAASATALAALASTANTAGADSLAAFLKNRQKNKAKSDAVVSKAVEALRFNRMRSVVQSSDADIQTLSRELQLHLINLGVDDGFKNKSDRLRLANEAVLIADRNDSANYLNAINRLRAAHKDFQSSYPKTTIFKVGLVAEVHSNLADALSGRGSNEDVLKYIKSLKTLLETVRS